MPNGRRSEVTREEFLALEQKVEECLQNLNLQFQRMAQIQAELDRIRNAAQSKSLTRSA